MSELITERQFTNRLLSKSICDGDVKYVQSQLEGGLNVNHVFDDGKSLLDLAVKEKQRKIVTVLLKFKCNPNLINGIQSAPSARETDLEKSCMYVCIVRGDVEMTKELAKGGFDVNMRDTMGCSAVWHAVDQGNIELVKAVLESRQANVNLSDKTKLRPLHVACLHGHPEIARLLLCHKAVVDAQQMRGLTALVLACKSNCVKSVQYLLAYYANANFKSPIILGMSPLYTILHNPPMKRDPRIIFLLLEAGARVNTYELDFWKNSEKLAVFEDMPNLYHALKRDAEKPKSLKSSCAKLVRKILFVCKTQTLRYYDIEYHVKRLAIPKSLQDYILLKIV